MRNRAVFVTFLTFAAIAWLQAPSESGPNAETAKVDGVHSSILFKVKYFNASNFYGRFNRVKGSITTKENGIGSLEIIVDANSVDSADKKRDAHLKSGDFFDTKQFPLITFKSDHVKDLGGDKYSVQGKLTLRGVTRDMTVEFTRTGRGKGRQGEPRTGFEAVFKIDRKDFGVSYMVGPLGNEVTLYVSLAAIIQ